MSDANVSWFIRPAVPDDAHALCELINFAGEGLPLHVWEQLAEDGTSAWEVARRRARREEGSFSYRNAMVAEIEGKVAACMIGYPIPENPEEIDTANMPAMFVPLQELENIAAGTWYTDVLAVYPRYRGRGLGARLLELAGEHGAEFGSRHLSLVVSDANVRARALYERHGYTKRASRKMVKDGWENPGRNWVLMVK